MNKVVSVAPAQIITRRGAQMESTNIRTPRKPAV
jgi:hypothetical protein